MRNLIALELKRNRLRMTLGYACTMQFVTASLTAVLMSASSSIVGSACAAKAATAARAKPSFTLRAGNSSFM